MLTGSGSADSLSGAFVRYQSRAWSIVLVTLIIFSSIGNRLHAQDECRAVALAAYHANSCVITISREQAGNPLPVQVPGDTVVVVRITNPRLQESISVTAQTDAIASPDFGAAFVKMILDPLKSLVLIEQKKSKLASANDDILQEQSDLSDRFAAVVVNINRATTELSCLQSYQVFDPQPGDKFACSSALLTSATFGTARDNALSDISTATQSAIPIASMKAVDGEIASAQTECLALAKETKKAQRGVCLLRLDTLESNQVRLSDSNTNVQAARKTLIQAYGVITGGPKPLRLFHHPSSEPQSHLEGQNDWFSGQDQRRPRHSRYHLAKIQLGPFDRYAGLQSRQSDFH
jgi:hypothetical protein